MVSVVLVSKKKAARASGFLRLAQCAFAKGRTVCEEKFRIDYKQNQQWLRNDT